VRAKLLTIASVLAVLAGMMFLTGQASTKGTFQVSGAAIPTSATVPTAAQGGALNTSVLIDALVIANTDTSSHTILVEDCQATPFLLLNNYPIAASTTWTMDLHGIRFQGCFKWQSNSTTVMGTVTGTR
jgi:hypothetical protein